MEKNNNSENNKNINKNKGDSNKNNNTIDKNKNSNNKENKNVVTNKNNIMDNSKTTKNLSILVIGETGSGKSTFINTLTNYFLNGSIPDDIKVAIQTKYLKSTEKFKFNETDTSDRSKSQTDSCNDYTFEKDGYSFTFIDTPGLSDTRGGAQDDKNIEKISDAAENSKSLCAIAIVINSRNGRMTINLQNAITRLRGSIPDSLIANIFVIFTNGLKHDCNFDVNSLKMSIKPSNIFFFDNSAFSRDPKEWDNQSIKAIKHQFELSFETLDELLKMFKEVGVVSTKEFKDMKDIRFEIKQTLHKAKVDIGNLQKLQDQITIHQSQLALSNKNKESFKNFTKTNTISKVELVDAPYHSTICSSCNHVCHNNCGLEELSTKGANMFMSCAAMGGGQNCRICEGKCSYTVHYHGRKTMKTVQQTVEEELKELKDKYMKSVKDADEASKNVNSVTIAKKITDAALKQMTDNIVKSCKKLKTICSGFNLVEELNITLSQIEFEAKQCTSHDARKSADEMIRVIREITDKLNKESIFKNKNSFIPINENDIKSNHSKKSNNDEVYKDKDNTKSVDNGESLYECETCDHKFIMDISKFEKLKKDNKKILCFKCRPSSNSQQPTKQQQQKEDKQPVKQHQPQQQQAKQPAKKQQQYAKQPQPQQQQAKQQYEKQSQQQKQQDDKQQPQQQPAKQPAKKHQQPQTQHQPDKQQQDQPQHSDKQQPKQLNNDEKNKNQKKTNNVEYNCTICKKKNYLPKDTFDSVIKKGVPLTCNDCRKR